MNEHTDARFPKTAWTQLARAESDQDILSDLLRQYWSPVYAFLRRSGRDREHAAETTQDFFVSVVFERGLFRKADRDRGRFRSLLLKSLQNFMIDRSRSRRWGKINLDEAVFDRIALDAAEPDPSLAPAAAFEAQWASKILQAAVVRVREDCQHQSMVDHWTAYELRVLRPAIGPIKPPAISDIQAVISAKSAQQVSHMIQTVKRKMEAAVRSVVAETLDNPDLLDEETELIFRHLRLNEDR